jgi:hypothetical protein
LHRGYVQGAEEFCCLNAAKFTVTSSVCLGAAVAALCTGCMAALEAEWFLQGLETGDTASSMDQGDLLSGSAVEGRGAVQHDHHGEAVSGRKTPDSPTAVARAS